MPDLAPLPEHKETVVVVGTSVRKSVAVLKPYLDSLAWQNLPPRTRLHYVFVPDGLETDAQDCLAEFVKQNDGELLRGVPGSAGDFSDAHPTTHQWSLSAMRRVGANKNKILRRAFELHADYIFLCDADLILDTTTMASLLAAEKPITTAVYWTHWHAQGYETRQIHAAPQVWLNHPYELQGRGQDEAEFRSKLLSRQLTRVWGFGACTLIARKVIEAGITFDPVPDVPQQGLMAGEDRQFCIRTERSHIEAYADPWPDIFHVYHLDKHVPLIDEYRVRLSKPHPQRPQLGDLISLKLEALEPIPHERGWTQVQRQHARGRLGQIQLMPELEEAVYDTARGDSQIVPVHFPVHHPLAYFRGRRRLIRMTLVDCKPWCAPPVVDQELFIGPRSGTQMDTTTLTTEQLDGMKEVAGAVPEMVNA